MSLARRLLPYETDTLLRHFEDCAEFCERWDQSSFDPDYSILPLTYFAPLVEEVFSCKSYDPAVIGIGRRVPMSNGRVAAERSAL